MKLTILEHFVQNVMLKNIRIAHLNYEKKNTQKTIQKMFNFVLNYIYKTNSKKNWKQELKINSENTKKKKNLNQKH